MVPGLENRKEQKMKKKEITICLLKGIVDEISIPKGYDVVVKDYDRGEMLARAGLGGMKLDEDGNYFLFMPVANIKYI